MTQTDDEASAAPAERRLQEAEHGRLQSLVAELLKTNEELRARVVLLEMQSESAERGLKQAAQWAGLLL